MFKIAVSIPGYKKNDPGNRHTKHFGKYMGQQKAVPGEHKQE